MAQGLMLCENACESAEVLGTAWVHEAMRVYRDRMHETRDQSLQIVPSKLQLVLLWLSPHIRWRILDVVRLGMPFSLTTACLFCFVLF
eukprot:1190629-Prorocentrum_minimum.AAC.4